MIEEIEKCIGVFYKQIQIFNDLLSEKFELESTPTYNEAGSLFPRKGELKDGDLVYKYQYHGMGCTIAINDVWINYNIDVLNNNEIVITARDIRKFIETGIDQTSEYKSSEIDHAFLELEKKKVLTRRNPEFMIFNIIGI